MKVYVRGRECGRRVRPPRKENSENTRNTGTSTWHDRDICYSYLVLVICTVDSSWGAKGKGRWSALHRFLRSSTHVTSMRILCFAAMEHQVPGTFTNKNVHHTWYNTYRYNLHTWYCSALDVVVPGLHYNQYCCSCRFW